LTLADNPALSAVWRNLNPRAVETLVSYFSEGSALMKRLDKLAGENALNVANTIIDNVALGKNPKTIAGLIRSSLGGGLTDALRMTRTVQIYSYREANRASYVANSDIVTGWYWMSALDPNSCMSCISLHGSFHTNDETLDDHHNGFCTMIPATKGSPNPFGENAGQKWFENLSEAEQRKYMGDGKFEAWKDNKFSFDQLSTTKTNDVFGDMRTETSLKDLIGSDSISPKEQWINSLNEQDQQVVRSWGASGRDIRNYQSGDISQYTQKEIEELKIKNDTFQKILDNGVKYDGTVYRGLNEVPKDTILEWKNSGTISLNNDQSSSYNVDMAKTFSVTGNGDSNAVLFNIENKSGINLFEQTKVTYGNKLISEYEVVIRKGTEYQVTNVDYILKNGQNFTEKAKDYFMGTDYSWPNNLPAGWNPSDDFVGHYVFSLKEIK
jgi:hypothetical protein